jgi:hypothetical protein
VAPVLADVLPVDFKLMGRAPTTAPHFEQEMSQAFKLGRWCRRKLVCAHLGQQGVAIAGVSFWLEQDFSGPLAVFHDLILPGYE